MSRYRQLSIEERCSIARLYEDGQSIRQIATALDRQPSTIARELKRNCGAKVGYQPAYAQAQAAKLAAKPATSLRVTKALMRQSNTEALHAVMLAELQQFGNLLRGPATKEAISAVMEKRKPDFSKC